MNIWKGILRKTAKNEPKSKKLSFCETKFELICQRCKQTSLEYDGLLNLRCKACGAIITGSFT